MAKAPEPGRVKTRLAAAVGDARAAEIARAFLEDTWSVARAVADSGVETSLTLAGPSAGLTELEGAKPIVPQGEGDLGRRMARHLSAGVRERGRCVVVGTDAIGLDPAWLIEAFRALAESDVVVGPAEDGGFWLLGWRVDDEALLDDLPWSSPQTLAATVARCESRGLRVARLQTWFDVDEVSELERLAALLREGKVSAPATLRALGLHGPSLIVPTLDEARLLPELLDRLCALPGAGRIVVADGGSTDGTLELARDRPGVVAIAAPRGRARQLNAGAEAAGGDVLLFHHADVELPADAMLHVAAALRDRCAVAGAFRIRHVPSGGRWRLGPLLRLADVRSHLSTIPYGDQALFVRREVFERVGGYPDVELMEDVAFAHRLRAEGRIVRCPGEVRVSARRFEARPIYYTTLVNLFPWLYRLGVSPRTLARLYHHTR